MGVLEFKGTGELVGELSRRKLVNVADGMGGVRAEGIGELMPGGMGELMAEGIGELRAEGMGN